MRRKRDLVIQRPMRALHFRMYPTVLFSTAFFAGIQFAPEKPIHTRDELIRPRIEQTIWCEFIHKNQSTKTNFLVPERTGGQIEI